MAKDILRNVRIFAGGCDLTGQSNKIELTAEYDEKDITNFASVDASLSVWKEVMAGDGSGKIGAAGQWEAGDTSKVDDDAFAALGGVGAWTIAPIDGNAGSLAYVAKVLRMNYQFGGAQGDVNMWAANASSSGPIARGASLHPPGTARTATGNGTAVQLGAISATQHLYANLHVLSVSGTSTPTVTVKIQSDDNSGMTSPTDRLTFTATTARSGESLSLIGAVTDDWWRVVYTISGSSPSFLFIASAGIAV